MRTWAKISVFLLCGYSLFGKTFAYLGVPPAKIFIGDIALALFVVCCTGAIVRPLLEGLLRPTPFSALFWGLTIFVSYGFVELVRGLSLGYPPVLVLQGMVVNIYPFYFFAGLWAALIYPDIVPRTIKFISWFVCLHAIAYYVFLRKIHLNMPGSDIEVFAGPSSGLALMGITYFEKELRRWFIPMAGNLLIVLAGQVRTEWLSLTAVLLLQGFLVGKLRRLAWSAAFVVVILTIGFMTDVSIPSPSGRGLKSVSAREIVARAVATVDRDAALGLSRKNTDFYQGTISWRQRWWKEIWPSVHVDTETALLGHGYGFALSGLVPYLKGLGIRTPHNIFFYCLGYTGWIGVVIFFGFQAVVGLTMYRAFAATGQPFGLVFWLGGMLGAMFGDFFEAPQGAIPYYLTIGMVAADLVARPARGVVPARVRESRPDGSWRQMGRPGLRGVYANRGGI